MSFRMFSTLLAFSKVFFIWFGKIKIKIEDFTTVFSKVIDNIIYDLAFSGFVISDLALSGFSHFETFCNFFVAFVTFCNFC